MDDHMSKEERLKELAESMEEEIDGPLAEEANNVVPGEGDPDARLMFIGEAPGRQEDEQGRPFVGRAGDILEEMLESIQLSREDVFISNVLRYRPPGNRDPAKDEIKRHSPYLVEQIKIIEPEVLVTLGNFATRFITGGFDADGMGEIEGISKIHGEPRYVELDGRTYTVFPTYHPAAAIYNRELLPVLEEDFKQLKGLLGQKKLTSLEGE